MAKSRALMFLVLLVSSLTVIACQEELADNAALPKTQVVSAPRSPFPVRNAEEFFIDLTKVYAYAAASSALVILGGQWSGRMRKLPMKIKSAFSMLMIKPGSGVRPCRARRHRRV